MARSDSGRSWDWIPTRRLVHLGIFILVLVAVRAWGPDQAAYRIGSGASWLQQRLGISFLANTVGGYVRPLAARIGDVTYDATQAALQGIENVVDGGWNALARTGRRIRNATAGTDSTKPARPPSSEPAPSAGP